MACYTTSLTSALVVGLLLASCFLNGGESAQCMPDKINPCRATCNGTYFDLSKAFDFPINITEPGPRSDGRTYWYMWSPCEPYPCYSGERSALCQKADMFYNCGDGAEPIFLFDYYYELGDPTKIKNADFPGFQIQYPWGTSWRIAVFHFLINDNAPEPTISFVSEDPGLQYNFLIVGKCIGQDNYECKPFYAEREKNRVNTKV